MSDNIIAKLDAVLEENLDCNKTIESLDSNLSQEEASLQEGWDDCENEPECPKMSKVISTELNGRTVYIVVYEENGIIHASIRDVY